jgi:hypothetical protein
MLREIGGVRIQALCSDGTEKPVTATMFPPCLDGFMDVHPPGDVVFISIDP